MSSQNGLSPNSLNVKWGLSSFILLSFLYGCMPTQIKWSDPIAGQAPQNDVSKLVKSRNSNVAIILSENTKDFVRFTKEMKGVRNTIKISDESTKINNNLFDPKNTANRFAELIKKYVSNNVSVQPSLEAASSSDLVIIVDRWQHYDTKFMVGFDLEDVGGLYFIDAKSKEVLQKITGNSTRHFTHSGELPTQLNAKIAEINISNENDVMNQLESKLQIIFGRSEANKN